MINIVMCIIFLCMPQLQASENMQALEKITFDDMRQALMDGAQNSFQALYPESSLAEKVKTDKRGNTLVHLVLKYGNDSSLKMLEPDLEKFNLNILDVFGNTPLHLALKKQKSDFAKKLIPNTNCTIQNYIMFTPLDYAYYYGQEDVAGQILDGTPPSLVSKFNELHDKTLFYKERLEKLYKLPSLTEDESREKKSLEKALEKLDVSERKEAKVRIALLIRCRLFPGAYPVSQK